MAKILGETEYSHIYPMATVSFFNLINLINEYQREGRGDYICVTW